MAQEWTEEKVSDDAIYGDEYIGDYTLAGDDPFYTDDDNRDQFDEDAADYYKENFGDSDDMNLSQNRREYILSQRAAREMGRRREYGLENEKMYEYANRLAEIAEGERKTAGQISAEKELALLASGQRGLGRTRGRGSFDAAEALRLGGLAAQGVESEGGALIASSARQAQGAADAQLEQLLIAGQERAADRALNMEMLRMQQEQASGALWSNVLTGVLGAVGTVVGAVIPGASAATAAIGGAIGSSAGSAGRYMG